VGKFRLGSRQYVKTETGLYVQSTDIGKGEDYLVIEPFGQIQKNKADVTELAILADALATNLPNEKDEVYHQPKLFYTRTINVNQN